MASRLSHLHAALQSLNSYELPEKFRPASDDAAGGSAEGDEPATAERDAPPPSLPSVLDPSCAARFQSARDAFLLRRAREVFLEHLGTYDESSGSFALPSRWPGLEGGGEFEEEGAAASRRSREAREACREAAERVDVRSRALLGRHQSLVLRKEEIGRVIQDLEREEDKEKNRKRTGVMGSGTLPDGAETDDSDQDSADGSSVGSTGEMQVQEDRLNGLIDRRNELESRLRRIRAETEAAEVSGGRARKEAEELIRRRKGVAEAAAVSFIPPQGTGGGETKGVETVALSLLNNPSPRDQNGLVRLEAETARLCSRAVAAREAAEWYDSVREASEELSGVRFLGAKSAPSPKRETGGAESNAGSLSEMLAENQPREELLIKLQILDDHTLQVGLSPSSGPVGKHRSGALCVTSAKFLTPTMITDTMLTAEDGDFTSNEGDNNHTADNGRNDKTSTATPAVTLAIPPPDDLIHLSRNLPPPEDLRFVVRECVARVRALTLRAEELVLLRTTYLTKIAPLQSGTSLAEKFQEVVCSLPQGITVMFRLSPDCPLLVGSVIVDQIVGVGDWDSTVLEVFKNSVNARGCRGPMEAMDFLVKELKRAETEGLLTMPQTPKLPSRLNHGAVLS